MSESKSIKINYVIDTPGMIEAKVISPNCTSTPLKPFGNADCGAPPRKLINPFDSGYNSILQESKTSPIDVIDDIENEYSTCEEQASKKPSLFESILNSRNSSISLEQLVEKVNWKKEQKAEKEFGYRARPRSYSTSELTSKRKKSTSVIPGSTSGFSTSSIYSNLSFSSSNDSKSSVFGTPGFDGQSPTLDQVLCMGTNNYQLRCDRSYSDGDYDLSELISSLQLLGSGSGVDKFPRTPSPDEDSYRRTPESLFGLEAFHSFRGRNEGGRVKPKLECISENVPDPCCVTPEEYYTTGTSPLPQAPMMTIPFQVGIGSGPPIPPSSFQPPHFESLASSTWSGLLPQKQYSNPVYSCKIFLGGVPWDVTEVGLVQAFSQFGPIRIEWPGKESSPSPPKGYVYIVFDHERFVANLLSQCSQSNGAYYFKISSRRMRSKEVQIIPWVLDDSNFIKHPNQKLDAQKTVFVGALHGMLNAEILAKIFNDLFGGVVYAGIDTDKHKYPIGSGRVTFSSTKSYMKAVSAAFVEIKCQQFIKKVQVDPYLEDALCSMCLLKQGPYFCRELICFKYFCRYCWESVHCQEMMKHHKPLMRNTRTGGGPATRPTISLTQAINNVENI